MISTPYKYLHKVKRKLAMRSVASEPPRPLRKTLASCLSNIPFVPLREIKRVKAFCILLCAMLSAFAAGPRIEFPETSKSLGTFRLDLIQTMDFEFVNTGDEPLVILNVNTDCGCTAAGYPHDEIAPGDTAKISVRYNGRNNPTGTFRKQVRVRSNDPENPLVRLFIKGKAIKG